MGFIFLQSFPILFFLLVLDGTSTFQAKIEDVDVPTRVSAPEAEEIWRTTTANQAFVDSTWERMFWVSMLCLRASDHVTDLNHLFSCFYNDFHLNNSWCFLSRTKKNSETYWSAEENNTPKSTRWYTQLYLPSNPIDWKKQNRATKSGQAAGILPRGGMSPPLCDTTSWSQRRSSKAQKDPWTVSSSSSICFDPPTIRRSTTVCSWRSTRPPSRCSKWSFPMSLLEHLRWNLFMISSTSVVMERYATSFSHTLIALGPQTENSSFLERNHSEQSRTIQHRLHGGSCSWNLHDWTALQGGQPVPLAIQALPSKRRLQFGR